MRRIINILLLFVIIACITSCTSPINKANFEQIEAGMTVADVISILGRPKESSTLIFGDMRGTSSKWSSRNGTISIFFFNNKVKVKQFIDGVTTPREE